MDTNWNRLTITNNIIANNVAALAGGGISLQDVLRARIVNNTIVNNDSTATASLAFAPGAANSTPQPAGVVTGAHSAALQALLPAGSQTYSNPVLLNNIVWHNRSFFNNASLNGGAGGLAPDPAGPYWDLAVINTVGTPPALNPDDTILSTLTSHGITYSGATNIASANPGFVLSYSNVLSSATVIDEGGNNINVRYTPLDPAAGNYHITATSPAVNQGSNAAGVPTTDFDGNVRALTAANPADIGADEVAGPGPGPTIPVLALLDNFNRANAGTLGGNWSQPSLLGQAIIRVNANQAYSLSLLGLAANAYWNGTNNVFGATQGAAFTFANGPGNNSALVLKAGNGTAAAPAAYIRVRFTTSGTDRVIVETTTNGSTFTARGAAMNTTFATGDTLTAVANAAGLVTVWKTTAANVTTQLGTVQLPTTGTNSWMAGGGRIGMQLPTFNTRVDNFSGGNVAP